MQILTKKNPEGRVIPQTYYSRDYHFEIEKGVIGWNVNERDTHGFYRYSFTCETLADVRESISFIMPAPIVATAIVQTPFTERL